MSAWLHGWRMFALSKWRCENSAQGLVPPVCAVQGVIKSTKITRGNTAGIRRLPAHNLENAFLKFRIYKWHKLSTMHHNVIQGFEKPSVGGRRSGKRWTDNGGWHGVCGLLWFLNSLLCQHDYHYEDRPRTQVQCRLVEETEARLWADKIPGKQQLNWESCGKEVKGSISEHWIFIYLKINQLKN